MITRRGAILAAAMTALITLITTSITVYSSTRAQNSDKSSVPATETVVVTETVPRNADAESAAKAAADPTGPATDGTVAGEISLAEKTPQDGARDFERTAITVRQQERPRSLIADLQCSPSTIGFNVDPGMRTFRTLVGLSDQARSDRSAKFTVFLDGEQTGAFADVQVGEVAELTADVTDGFRVAVRVEPDCVGPAALIDPVLRP
ncbi:hypothetical protein GCM10027563_18030 [Parasphingorhabdus pacifica]